MGFYEIGAKYWRRLGLTEILGERATLVIASGIQNLARPNSRRYVSRKRAFRIFSTHPSITRNPFYEVLFDDVVGEFQQIFVPKVSELLKKVGNNKDQTNFDLVVFHQLDPHLGALGEVESDVTATFSSLIDALDKRKVPILYFLHNEGSHDESLHSEVAKLESVLLKAPNVFLAAMSPFAREHMLRRGFARERILDWGHPDMSLAHGVFSSDATSGTFRNEKITVGLFGDYRESKDVQDLVDLTMSTHWSKLEPEFDLHIAGRGVQEFCFPSKSNIFIEDLDLKRNEYGKRLSNCDFVFVPSQDKNWVSGSVMTALSYGKPVIQKFRKKDSWFLETERNSILYGDGHCNSLLEALMSLKEQRIQELSAFAAASARKTFYEGGPSARELLIRVKDETLVYNS